jgi:hypothetical protein
MARRRPGPGNAHRWGRRPDLLVGGDDDSEWPPVVGIIRLRVGEHCPWCHSETAQPAHLHEVVDG